MSEFCVESGSVYSSGDSSQSSSVPSPHTPPPKPSKSSTRHHRGHKYKAKKGHKASRKRKDKASSSVTESTSSDSDCETSKKYHDRSKRGKIYKYPANTTPQLVMAHHYQVTKLLGDLNNGELIRLGGALGLYRPNLEKMNIKDLCGDVVKAWLRRDSNVEKSPSWASLATALEEIGHKGVASKIREGSMQAVTPFSPDISSVFLRYQNYLKSYYKINSVAHDDKLSIAPCSEFIHLALIKRGEYVSRDDTFSRSTLYGGRDQISACKVPLELDTILTPESKFVLVEGAPGTGKSTLSWELCRKWDTLKCLQHYSIVFLLKLCEGRVQNASSLNELFYHRDRALRESVASEVLRCEGEGVLLILDGFDELPASVVYSKESLIMEIISGTCIPRATIIITSRPSALQHKRFFPQKYRHVEIVGFTNENIKKFAEITFKSEPNVLSEFKKFIFSNPVIKSLMYIPINCAILAQSYKDIVRSRKQVSKTTTQLYTMLTRILIRRHLIGTERWEKDSKVPGDLKDLPEDVCRDLERISKLAYTGLFKEDVQLVFTDGDVGEGFHPLGLLSEVKEMYVCEGAMTSYSFLHLSIQEFLAAWYVSCHQELVEEALSKTLCSDSPHLHVFGRILAGLIGISEMYMKNMIKWYENDKPDLVNFETHNSNAVLYMCHCLYEAQNNAYNASYTFVDIFELSSPLDQYVFGYCLAYYPLQWSHVYVRSSSIDMLVSSLADHASGNKVSGSIWTLQLYLLNKLKDLPQSLLDSIDIILLNNDHPSPTLLDGMPYFEGICSGSKLISRYYPFENVCFPNLTKFLNLRSLDYYGKLSERGLYELAKSIASSSTIEEVLLYCGYSHILSGYEPRYASLARAALSCPSLKSIVTDFPFAVSNNTSGKNLQTIQCVFEKEELPKLFDYLYNIADMCKISPLQEISLELDSFSPSSLPYDFIGSYYDCISLLNVCLHHHWPSMEILDLPYSISCTQFHLNSLSRALRRDPDTSQLKLRRSKSLSDLVHLKKLDEHRDWIEQYTSHTKKSESCPDLVGMQTLHPLMAEQLLRNYPLRREDLLLHVLPYSSFLSLF